MFPQFACNLIATLSYPTFEERPLDWNLRATKEWEKRIPFHIYIQPSASTAQTPSFPQFCNLPAELQLHIIDCCSPDTLYQLMHVSSAFRKEASKLFWASPNAYFVAEMHWLLQGGHPGETYSDMAFLKLVQNIEIVFTCYDIFALSSQIDDGFMTQHDRITAFWSTFADRFPCKRRLLISCLRPRPPSYPDPEPVISPLHLLVQACPFDIEIFVLIRKRPKLAGAVGLPTQERPFQHTLYQLRDSDTWTKTSPDPYRMTILPAPKEFKGPVGEFRKLDYEAGKSMLKRHSLWPLTIEAVARQLSNSEQDGLFSCPISDCNDTFTSPAEWMMHAAQAHISQARQQQPWRYLELLPDDVKAEFDQQEKALQDAKERLKQQHRKMKDEWYGRTGRTQADIKQAWMEQLENDEAWSTRGTPEESMLWAYFLNEEGLM